MLDDCPDLVCVGDPWTSGLVSRALRNVDMRRPGAAQASLLLSRGRRPSTKCSYASKFDRFCFFCDDEQVLVGLEPLCSMPAAPSTVLLYLGYLQAEDKVHASSLQPYLSAINQAHIDFGFPAPAMGHLLRLARRGFAEVEGEATLTTAVRSPLPSAVAFRFLQLGLATDCFYTLRACACLTAQFAWFARADTGVLMRKAHVSLSSAAMSINERTKTIARNQAAPIIRPQDWFFDPANLFMSLQQRWASERRHAETDFYWSLPDENLSSSCWNSSIVNHWLQEILDILDIQPPAGVLWSAHSLRSGGATGAYSIGVDSLIVMRFGLWKCLTSAQIYIDVLALPDVFARLFFGHLLRTDRPLLGPQSVAHGLWAPPGATYRHCVFNAGPRPVVVSITLVDSMLTQSVSSAEILDFNSDLIDAPVRS